MTIQERIEQQAGRVIGRIGGVFVTIKPRNITVQANIDRLNKPFAKVESEVHFQGELGVSVFIQKRLLNTAPKIGEIIAESSGAEHRIGIVKDLGQRWQCLCESTE